MKFWDASGVVPLLVEEAGSGRREEQLREDPAMLVWWGTPVECVSALQRLVREEALTAKEATAAEERLRQLESGWIEIEASPQVRQQAQRLLRVHPLRAADALQLAAALVACSNEPVALPFVAADQRLREAAAKEGFPVFD
jgi:predicted nucleic acid-binding protein